MWQKIKDTNITHNSKIWILNIIEILIEILIVRTVNRYKTIEKFRIVVKE